MTFFQATLFSMSVGTLYDQKQGEKRNKKFDPKDQK